MKNRKSVFLFQRVVGPQASNGPQVGIKLLKKNDCFVNKFPVQTNLHIILENLKLLYNYDVTLKIKYYFRLSINNSIHQLVFTQTILLKTLLRVPCHRLSLWFLQDLLIQFREYFFFFKQEFR